MKNWGVVVAALVLLGATTAVGYRVFAPADTLAAATTPYPSRPVQAQPVRYGRLTLAPLIVDDRLRIYTEERRVWADTPVTAKLQFSPFWSYRRWPARLNGVVTVEPAGGRPPIVFSTWSDGALVAIDATTGRIAWRADGDPKAGVPGRRTGAPAVYEPPGLYTTESTSDSRTVLIVSGTGQVRGYDPWTGRVLWQRTRCDRDWTGLTTYLCASGSTVDVLDAATGRQLDRWQPSGVADGAQLEPWNCRLGRSGCELLAAGDASWRVDRTGAVTAEPYAHPGRQFVAGTSIVEWMTGRSVRAIARDSGDELWQASTHGYVGAIDDRYVYVVDPDATLTELDLASGAVHAVIGLRGEQENRNWWVRNVYVHDGFVAMERMSSENPNDGDDRYFYGKWPIVLAGA
jgi:hypothetical protein